MAFTPSPASPSSPLRLSKRPRVELPAYDHNGGTHRDLPTPASTKPFIISRRSPMPSHDGHNADIADDLVDEDLDWNEVSKADPASNARRDRDDWALNDDYFTGDDDDDDDDSSDQYLSYGHSPSIIARDETSESVRPPLPTAAVDSGSPRRLATVLVASDAQSTPPPQPYSTPPNALAGPGIRTCFHLCELQQQVSDGLGHSQDAVFQLYARVQHAYRENTDDSGTSFSSNNMDVPASSERSFVQHFQFLDIIQDDPCVGGMLTGCRLGDVVDRQSAAFLDIDQGGAMRLCRCVCMIHACAQDEKSPFLAISHISEVDWSEVSLLSGRSA